MTARKKYVYPKAEVADVQLNDVCINQASGESEEQFSKKNNLFERDDEDNNTNQQKTIWK